MFYSQNICFSIVNYFSANKCISLVCIGGFFGLEGSTEFFSYTTKCFSIVNYFSAKKCISLTCIGCFFGLEGSSECC